MANEHHKTTAKHAGSQTDHYLMLFWMIALSFGSMYVLMYAMVDVAANVYNSFNQVYMAGLMAAPMLAIELSVMRGMYPNKRLNAILIAASLVVAAVFFFAIRRQTAISDEQFLRSMIPHHAGAILMCQEADINDARVSELCRSIITNQRTEIDQMKELLRSR